MILSHRGHFIRASESILLTSEIALSGNGMVSPPLFEPVDALILCGHGRKGWLIDRLIRSGASVYWTLVLYEWQVASAGDKVSLEWANDSKKGGGCQEIRNTNYHRFKSCILWQNAELLRSGRSPLFSKSLRSKKPCWGLHQSHSFKLILDLMVTEGNRQKRARPCSLFFENWIWIFLFEDYTFRSKN